MQILLLFQYTIVLQTHYAYDLKIATLVAYWSVSVVRSAMKCTFKTRWATLICKCQTLYLKTGPPDNNVSVEQIAPLCTGHIA